MTTNSNAENESENTDGKGKSNNPPGPLSDAEKAILIFEKLKTLRFRLISSLNDSTAHGAESAYKRRGVQLKHIPHSSEKIAKNFDDSI